MEALRDLIKFDGGNPIDLTSWPVIVGGLVAVVVAIVAADYAAMLNKRRTLPPGPFPMPIVGNTFQLPDVKPWVWFEELAVKYNAPMVTIWIGRRPTVWLCDAWAADELMNKRANIYSSRPRMVVFGELGTGDHNLVTMKYGDRWRELRKVTHHGVGMQQVRSYQEIQNQESKQIPWDIMNDPADYVMAFERYAASVVSVIGFGRRLQSSKDPIISEVIYAMHLAAALNVPGKSMPMLIETFPILAKAPRSMPWMRGVRGRKKSTAFFYGLAKEAAEDNPNESYCKELFSDFIDQYKLSQDEVASLAGNLFGAGSDTSSSTLISFVLACVAFPEVLQKAWDELDAVVGHERSPSYEDQENLPYINAFVAEVLRWRSVAIIGGQPHAPIQDDHYTHNGKSYIIPKGTWVQANLWAIHRHPRDFPEPDRFNPDRYLKENRLPYPDRKGYSAFGYGRRVCAGQALAEQGTYISVARMLWAFNITKAIGKDGKPVEVDIFAYTNGLNMRPREFPAQFIPRNETIKATVEREAKEALEEMERYNTPTRWTMAQGQTDRVKFS